MSTPPSGSCSCGTISHEYSDHRFECPVYVAGRAARIARMAGTKPTVSSKERVSTARLAELISRCVFHEETASEDGIAFHADLREALTELEERRALETECVGLPEALRKEAATCPRCLKRLS